jgi:molybdopterin-synthase adenylyltransferase
VSLSDDRVARWSRQLIVPGFGEGAQERLLAARVRVVGADGVASAAVVALVQAGIGRLWLEDAETVGPADLMGWLFPPAAVGTGRVEASRAAVAPLSTFASVERYPVGGVPDATLVCAPSVAQALAVAEAARRAGIPHAVVEPDGDGGAIVSVPPGAPCYACARSASGTGRPPSAGISALASLAALELVQMIATPEVVPGRRIDLVRGVASARTTLRLAGCVCSGAQPAED